MQPISPIVRNVVQQTIADLLGNKPSDIVLASDLNNDVTVDDYVYSHYIDQLHNRDGYYKLVPAKALLPLITNVAINDTDPTLPREYHLTINQYRDHIEQWFKHNPLLTTYCIMVPYEDHFQPLVIGNESYLLMIDCY